jgi:hypothetical protein
MVKVRCRFGIRVPFLKNLGVIVVYLPFDIAGRVSEAITLLKMNGGKDTDRIVWEVE